MRKYIICGIILSLALTVGCSKPKEEVVENNIKEDVVETMEEKEYSEFNFLDEVYTKNEDITLLNQGEEIFNINQIAYVEDKYIEVDFALDVVENYLQGNLNTFDYLITLDSNNDNGYIQAIEEEKNNLTESLGFLREQMYIEGTGPVYFRPSKVIYNGKVDGIEDAIELKIVGHISSDNINFQSLSTFTITVVKDKDKILANII